MPTRKLKDSRPDDRDEFLATPRLQERGWTDSLIRRFLPEPDTTRTNLHYRSGPPMRLYRLERVEAIEQTDEFTAARKQAEKRQNAATRAVATKIEHMMQYVDDLEIVVPQLEKEELIRRACKHYNHRQNERVLSGGSFDSLNATPDSSPEFLERIMVNYLRHRLTRYDNELDQIASKTGAAEARRKLKAKVLEAIAATYPWLKAQCHMQLLQQYY